MNNYQELAPVKVPESPDYLMFTLQAMTSAEAKKKWRAAIKKAWQNRCAYCNQPPIDDKSLTIDHVRPKSKGGANNTKNCIPACRQCNHEKGSLEWREWYRLQPNYSLFNELRILNWLENGTVGDFYDEKDSEWLDSTLETLFNELQ